MKALLVILCLGFMACSTEEPAWKMQDEIPGDKVIAPSPPPPEIAPGEEGCIDVDGFPTACKKKKVIPKKLPKKKKKKKSSTRIETLPVDESDSLARFNL